MQEKKNIPQNRTPAIHPGWIETTIQFVNADEEAIGSFIAECIEFGALGSVEAYTAEEASGGDKETCESCGTCTNVQAYFPESLGVQELVNLLESRTRAFKSNTGSPNVLARILRCRRIERQDWATAWKGSFPPERVSACFWVVPPWQSPPCLPAEAIPIILEPGLAFGTGKHPTTRHCLECLEEIAEQGKAFPRSFLDIGCGSGILSIAARRLGATRVVGLDIDLEALSVASRNLELNGLSRKVFLVNGSPGCCRPGFELIAANLDAKTLLKYRKTLWSLPVKGGLAVLSGMLDEQAPEVTIAFQKLGFLPVSEKKDHEEGWTSVLLRKP